MTKANYDEIVQQLTKFNVSLTDVNGEYRSTYDIMKDIAAMWGDMTSMEQAAMATALAGTRQQAIFYSIINNFQEASGAMDAMSNSAGALETAYSTYMESAQAHINQFKAAFQELAYNLVSSGTISFFVDLGTAIVNVVTSLTRAKALLPSIIGSLLLIKSIGVVKSLRQSASVVNALASSIIKEKTVTDVLAVSVAKLTLEEKKNLAGKLQAAFASGKLTEEEHKQILATLGLVSAEGAATGATTGFAASLKALFASNPFGWIAMGISTLYMFGSAMIGASKSTEELTEELNQQQQEIKQISDSYNQMKESTESIIPKFVELAKGVNEFGEKTEKLTDEEYKEFVKLNNQLAETFPDINLGMDKSNRAMLALSYSSDTLTESLRGLLEVQRDLANQQIAEKIPDYLKTIEETQKSYNKEIEKYKKDIEFAREVTKEDKYTTYYNYSDTKKLLDAIGVEYSTSMTPYGRGELVKYEFDFDTSSEDFQRKLDAYIKRIDKQIGVAEERIKQSWNKLNPAVNAWLQTDYIYNELNDRMKQVVSIMVSGLDFSALGLSTNEEIQNYIKNNIIDPINASSPEVKEAFSKITDWQKQLNSGDISFDEFESNVRNLFNTLREEIGDDKFFEIFVAGYNKAGVAGKNFDEVVQSIINNWGILNNSAENQEFTNSISKLVDAMERLKSAYDIVSKAQKEMLTGGISTDTVKSLADFIDKYNEAFEANVDYLDYLYEENGVIKLNIDALKEFANVEMSGSISAIEGDISRLEERRKELQKNIDAQEAISGHHLAGFLWESDDLKKSKEELSGINKEIDENQKKLGIYKSIFDSLTSSYERTISTIEGAIVSVDKLSSGFDNLDKMYADVFNKEDFNFASLIDDKFIETFGSYTEEFDKFIATVANSPTDIKACQDAFDDLVTTYLKHSDIMDGLTDETRDVTVAMLEQMGVANAAEVVDYNLALQKERLKYETAKYRDMTLEEVQALYNESEAGSLTQQVLAELALEKMEINANTIRTSEDIDNVIALANAANVSTQSLRNLTAAKIAFDKAEQYRLAGRKLIEQQELYGDMSAYAEATKMFELARDEQRKAEEYFNQKIEFNPFDSAQFKAKYVGGTATQSARDSAAKAAEKAKKEAEKAETWFEREYKLHQHLVKMELETDKDYFTWLNSAYQRAYKEGILTLDEYRKYQEEVFSGLRALFEDYLSDIEHEISMREEFDSEKNKIISLYKQLIKDVESEIKAARQYGLTDTDDYIQSLQKKWASYKDAIKDIEDDINNSAKDAIDELVDIRIKMLKQDIENERDALKKRLDYLKEFYQKQKDMLQDARDEEKYIEEQSAKRKAVSDIQAQMAQLEYDNSAWAQKRKLELAEELSKSQKELDDFEKEHALQTAQEELDKLYEMQEKELNAQEELLEAKENDTKALYEQALADIKNGSIQLYEEMIQWNDVYGDGISDTIKTAWEDAYVALKNYKDLYGTLYNDVNLANATGYVAPKSSWDTTTVYGGGKAASPYGNSGSSSSAKSSTTTSASKTAATTTTATTATGSVNVDDLTKQRVSAAIWNGGYGWGRGKERAAKLAEVFGENNGIQALVNANVGRSGPAPSQEYTYLNMRKKLRGYASGTSNATVGLHSIDELGTETIFQSADGAKYKMFTGTEKVLNAKASTFLYNFANKGGEILDKIMRSVFGNSINNIGQPVMASNIQMGDIIINGNADKATVSEIRRAQRDSVEMLLKEFNRLNK